MLGVCLFTINELIKKNYTSLLTAIFAGENSRPKTHAQNLTNNNRKYDVLIKLKQIRVSITLLRCISISWPIKSDFSISNFSLISSTLFPHLYIITGPQILIFSDTFHLFVWTISPFFFLSKKFKPLPNYINYKTTSIKYTNS